MIAALAALALLQDRIPVPAPLREVRAEPWRVGLETGTVLTRFDKALGRSESTVEGLEIALRWGVTGEGWLLSQRLALRRWEDIEFNRFEKRDVSLSGRAFAAALELELLFDAGSPAIRFGFGGSTGAFRIEHDLQKDDSFQFTLGPAARWEPARGFFVSASAMAMYAQTDFGHQHRESWHLSGFGRLLVGFDFRF